MLGISKTANKNRAEKNNSRRGFSLLELIIVMALVAILSAIVLTFTILTSNNLAKATSYANFISDSNDLQSTLRTSFAEMDTAEDIHVVSVSDNILSINKTELINLADYNDIDGISFDIDQKTNKLLKITLTNNSAKLKTTFIVTSRTGAKFGKGGQSE